MAGYAAAGRITGVHPRLVSSRVAATDRPARRSTADLSRARTVDPPALDARLVAWWADAREEWAQATFYLFDPNSWR